MSLRFAYSTINWGETPDLEKMFGEIRDAGWEAVELFWHSLDWLGPMPRLLSALGDLQVATMFGAVSIPTDKNQLTKLKNHIDYGSELGAEAIGLVGGNRLRWRPPSAEEYSDLARFCEELAESTGRSAASRSPITHTSPARSRPKKRSTSCSMKPRR